MFKLLPHALIIGWKRPVVGRARLLLVLFLMSSLAVPALMAQVPRPADTRLQRQWRRAETAWSSGASMLEAKARAEAVLRQDPNHAGALRIRANVNLELGQYEQALADARAAVAVDPQDGATLLILAEAARLNNEIGLASSALARAAPLVMNEDANLHIRLSHIASQLGPSDYDRAEAFARVALNKDNANPSAYYQLARVFVLRGRNDEALTILKMGFEAELLEPQFVRQDTLLNALVNTPALKSFME